MRVKVKTFASFREIIGKREVEVELKGNSSVRDLLEELCKHYDLRALLFEGDALQKYIKILVNGEDVVFLQGLDTKLKSGDEIALFPPVAGG